MARDRVSGIAKLLYLDPNSTGVELVILNGVGATLTPNQVLSDKRRFATPFKFLKSYTCTGSILIDRASPLSILSKTSMTSSEKSCSPH